METFQNQKNNSPSKKNFTVLTTIIEVGFIVFLFYANLLMGEFNQSGQGNSKGLLWALHDIFSATNFIIAIMSGLIGHFVFGYIRKKL